VVAGLGHFAEHTIALVAYVVVLGSPLTHSCLIVFIWSSEWAILVRLYREIASSGTRCSSCKPMVLVTLGSCHLLDDLVACGSVEARKKIVRGSGEPLWRVLSLPHGSSWIDYSSEARGLEDPHLVSGCAAPAEGLTLDSQLARDPLSECIATTRTSLVATKWTSIKIIVSTLCISSWWFASSLWKLVFTLYT
jgi:hypothetical protein